MASEFTNMWQQFLKTLFRLAGGVLGKNVGTDAILAKLARERDLAFDPDIRTSVVTYLVGKQFVTTAMGLAEVAITTTGIDALQQAELI